jgi:putative PIN family toxin of toxin-antitoxin system
MKVYAVIDTNVLVSALLTRNHYSATYMILESLLERKIKILYNDDILKEYKEVLSRPKFHLPKDDVNNIINFVVEEGLLSKRKHSKELFPDPKDVVFYEVAISKENAYLVTGNEKHFPNKLIVVTPAEMLEILNREGLS